MSIQRKEKDVANKLKSTITNKMVTIEPKGVNSFKKSNHIHFLFTSGDEHFLPASSNEQRRFAVFKAPKKRAADIEPEEEF